MFSNTRLYIKQQKGCEEIEVIVSSSHLLAQFISKSK